MEASVSKVFDKLEVYIEGKDIQAFHRYDRTIIKFSNRKENLHIVHVNEDLNFLDLTQLDFSEAIKSFSMTVSLPIILVFGINEKKKGIGKLNENVL